MISHPFQPIFDASSRILILGTFPSVTSRKNDFYYGHPQNRFWKVMPSVFEQKEPVTVQEKTDFLLKNHVALWDVIKSCEIEQSSDSTIKDVVPNDIQKIILHSPVAKIYCNGTKSFELFQKYINLNNVNKISVEKLPSTSSANAAYSFERLVNEWKKIISLI